MAYKVKIGQFAKNIESTAQPDTTLWPEYDVVFKNGADISNPQITISATYANVQNANYAYMLGRYYWITAKNLFRENYIILQLRVDVLATYKTEIGSSSLYILRSSAASDGNVVDNYYPALANPTINVQNISTSFPEYSSGYYIINAIGTTMNASTLYQMNFATFRRVIANLLAQSDNAATLGSDVVGAVVNTMFKPLDYIRSVRWTPVPFNDSAISTLYLGKWSYAVQGGDNIGVITDSTITTSGSVSVPKHPQEARGNFLNFYPYTEYILYLQPYGVIPIPANKINALNSLNYYEIIDAQSGIGNLQVINQNSGEVIINTSCQYMVDVPIGSAESNGNVGASAMNIIGATAAFATGHIITGFQQGISAIGNALDFITPGAQQRGAAGSIAAFQSQNAFVSIFREIVDEDNARNGRPYCKVTTPGTLGGFMIAEKGDVVMSGPLPEHEEVKRYLETGFFYE